ncbi:MAG: 4-amino-4-deoxychorismate lyase [Flavobacteriales bacterium]|nr:MAG: 4-amino-4-deoxychorismate lyase [Flavobacteriales bacterium]
MTGTNYISFNGELLNADVPTLKVSNRAFRYGDALFDAVRIIDGKPCFLELHVERLIRSMNLLKMNIPSNFITDYFDSEIKKLLKENGINKGGRVRLTIFRDADGFYTPENNDVSFIIEAVPLVNNQFTLNEKGLLIDIYEDHRKNLNELSTIKSTNCLPYVLAGIHKREQELDECIMLNELGNIAEAISSNIFIIYNGVFYTPSINQGCLAGVMRKLVIEIAKENNIEVQECPLGPNALLRADEVLLTNAVNGVRWVGSFRMKRYFNKSAKLFTEKLNQKVSELVMG